MLTYTNPASTCCTEQLQRASWVLSARSVLGYPHAAANYFSSSLAMAIDERAVVAAIGTPKVDGILA
jgi:hypothetical protein